VYYELPLPARFDPARPVFLRFQAVPGSSPQVTASLKACGVPRGAACAADDPDCRAATECDTLLYNV
jgi:hypothetical protein